MFNCCSHGTLLIFSLQSSCLNICYYHQDLHPRRLHPRPRISCHALLLHLPGGAGETCRWCAPLRGWGIPPEPAGASLHLHCGVGARGHPLTRACIRLLGPRAVVRVQPQTSKGITDLPRNYLTSRSLVRYQNEPDKSLHQLRTAMQHHPLN